jgi:crossover junction endodeoxyribonuclease RusA
VGYSSEPRILRIELPSGLPLLNANDRLHYRERSKRTEKLRSEACKAAKAQPFLPFSRVRIRCIFRAPDKRRRDVANLYPSFKACIDGLVDAGVFRDDSDKYVSELCLVRGQDSPKKAQLILQVIEEPCDER